jgi:hypothetical protein
MRTHTTAPMLLKRVHASAQQVIAEHHILRCARQAADPAGCLALYGVKKKVGAAHSPNTFPHTRQLHAALQQSAVCTAETKSVVPC